MSVLFHALPLLSNRRAAGISRHFRLRARPARAWRSTLWCPGHADSDTAKLVSRYCWRWGERNGFASGSGDPPPIPRSLESSTPRCRTGCRNLRKSSLDSPRWRPQRSVSSEPQVSGALACGLREVVAEIGAPRDRSGARTRTDRRARDLQRRDSGRLGADSRHGDGVSGGRRRGGDERRDLHVRVARTSIERTFRRFMRMLLKSRPTRRWSRDRRSSLRRSYDCGRLEAKIPEPGRGVITLLDWPDAPDWPLRATRVGIESVLSIAGRRDVRVTCSRTSTGAIFSANWRQTGSTNPAHEPAGFSADRSALPGLGARRPGTFCSRLRLE